MNSKPPSRKFDVVIVGGGMIGASLALALQGQGLQIAIIEANRFDIRTQPNYDDRAIALAYGSRKIFEGMGVWPAMAPVATPIKDIHISDQGYFGITRLNYLQERVSALGYVITARELGNVLLNKLQTHHDDVTIISPATVSAVTLTPEIATCVLETQDGQETINSRLVIAADGGQSTLRELFKLETISHSYAQTAIIANISTEIDHANMAYERFTANGPLAVLPMAAKRCAIVWTQAQDKVDTVLALDDQAFLHQLQMSFGYRLGKITHVGKRHSYPLSLVHAKQQIQHRLVLIGNAAHTLHPIAGQGFNLGLRDVAVIAQLVTDAHKNHYDIGHLDILNHYLEWRSQDQQIITRFTDTLVKLFSNPFKPLALMRNAGLLAMDISPSLKHLVAQHTMGLAGKLPRLSMGLPL